MMLKIEYKGIVYPNLEYLKEVLRLWFVTINRCQDECSMMIRRWSMEGLFKDGQRMIKWYQRVTVQRWSMRGQRVTVQRWSKEEIKRGDCSKMIRGWSKGHCSLTLHTLAFGIIRWLNRTSKDSSWAESIDFFRRELYFSEKSLVGLILALFCRWVHL